MILLLKKDLKAYNAKQNRTEQNSCRHGLPSSQFGFTLSEVLITLGIIGVVAAMTIPNLINEYQKTQSVTQLKKFYVDFTQGLQNFSQDSGCPNDLLCTGLFNNDLVGHIKKDVYSATQLSSYLKFDKVCGGTSNGASNNPWDYGCFGYHLAQRHYKELDGDAADLSSVYELAVEDRMWVTMPNGVFFGLVNLNTMGTSGCLPGPNGTCAQVYVDVNGAKKPNQLGRDVFYFVIKNNATLIPRVDNDCSTTSGVGLGCSNKILKEGWEMNY